LAHAIATEAGCQFFNLAATEVVSGMSGESEAKLRNLFAAATAAAPSIIFIDEIDAITPKRETAQVRKPSPSTLPGKNAIDEPRSSIITWLAGVARVLNSVTGPPRPMSKPTDHLPVTHLSSQPV
jgi:hypothetical protein